MGSEGLQTLCTVILLAGLALASLGGAGSYYFGRQTASDRELKRLSQQREADQKSAFLQQINEGLLSRIVTLEEEKKTALLSASKASAEPAKQPHEHKPKSATHEESKVAAVHPQKTKPLQLASVQPVEKAPPPIMELLTPPVEHRREKNGRLTGIQRDNITSVLRKHSQKTITIKSAAGNVESNAFADELKRVFVEAGWEVDGIHQVAFAKTPDGLLLSTGGFPSPESLVATYEALTGARLRVSQQLDPKLHANQAELIVGK